MITDEGWWWHLVEHRVDKQGFCKLLAPLFSWVFFFYLVTCAVYFYKIIHFKLHHLFYRLRNHKKKKKKTFCIQNA